MWPRGCDRSSTANTRRWSCRKRSRLETAWRNAQGPGLSLGALLFHAWGQTFGRSVRGRMDVRVRPHNSQRGGGDPGYPSSPTTGDGQRRGWSPRGSQGRPPAACGDVEYQTPDQDRNTRTGGSHATGGDERRVEFGG